MRNLDSIYNKILFSIGLVAVLTAVHYIVLSFVLHRIKDIHTRYKVRKISGYAVSLIAIILLGAIWIRDIGSLSTFLGLLSAGLAIALRNPLEDLAAWFFIVLRKPFEVGDRIQIGNIMGDVIDIRSFQFTLLEIGNWVEAEQSTGRIVHIPNKRVFNEMIANYTEGFKYIWNEIPVVITFESNWRKAKEILLEIARRHAEQFTEEAEKEIKKAAKKFFIFYTYLTPTVYTKVIDYGIKLTIRYLCHPRKRRNSEQAIWEEILDTFAKCPDIDLAYPTYRYFNNLLEGKIKPKERQ